MAPATPDRAAPAGVIQGPPELSYIQAVMIGDPLLEVRIAPAAVQRKRDGGLGHPQVLTELALVQLAVPIQDARDHRTTLQVVTPS